jgi:hypothetical protein
VLKPAGRLIVTLEDMAPGWLDVMTPTFLRRGAPLLARMITRKSWVVLWGKSGQSKAITFALLKWKSKMDHRKIRDNSPHVD